MYYQVRVKPGAKKQPSVEPDGEGGFVACVRERPEDGKANAAMTELLARHFGVPKSRVVIVRGHTSRVKLVSVEMT